MAEHRHKRVSNARRTIPTRARAVIIAGPLAVLATAGAVTLGVAQAGPGTPDQPVAQSVSDVARDRAATSASPPRELVAADRSLGTVSRGTARNATKAEPTKAELFMTRPAVRQAIASADTKLWTVENLNLWSAPDEAAEQVGEIEAGQHVRVTGRSLLGREEIVVEGESRWVTAGYLSADEPFSLGGDCSNGTSVPSGVSPNIVKVHEAVCAEFPEITTYGTFRSDGEHAQGIAVDIMVSGDRGYEVAEFVRKYYAELGVNYLIYSQEIWSVDRASEGWRGMEDRGSTTANHYDHVHVTTY